MLSLFSTVKNAQTGSCKEFECFPAIFSSPSNPRASSPPIKWTIVPRMSAKGVRPETGHGEVICESFSLHFRLFDRSSCARNRLQRRYQRGTN